MGEIYDGDSKRKYACWLYSVPGIGGCTMEKLLALCPDEEGIFREGEHLWSRVLTERQLEHMREFSKTVTPDALWQEMEEKEIRFVLRTDPDYPLRLRDIPDPPYALFVRGRLPRETPSVAVVGARECSEYGKYVAEGIGWALGQNNVQVISGMARGIDGISQSAALEAGGSSYGVLGCGVDVCYPKSNQELYDRLCLQGGILSVHPPGTKASPQNFPPRNRIVSGLADALIVVEARQKSGTLITVDMALEQGREVYVVPGRVTDRLSDGCNKLIRQGAGVFLSPDDFLRELAEIRKRSGRGGAAAEKGREGEGAGQKAARREIAGKGREGGEAGQKAAERETAGKGREGGEAGQKTAERETAGKERECRDAKQKVVEHRLEELDGECRAVYAALDFLPLGIEQIQRRLPGECDYPKLISILMRLCLKKLAVQPSPGHFARKGKAD